MRLVVLGGGGFIGSHLVDVLLAHGHSLRVFGRRGDACRDQPPEVDRRIADFADSGALAAAVDGCDAVLHLINTAHPAGTEGDSLAEVEGNLAGTRRLLRTMHNAGVDRLLYLSSGGAVYGIPGHHPTPESQALRPIGSYGIVKAAIERQISIATEAGLIAAVIRPANVYGPRQMQAASPGFITTALMHLARNKPLAIFGTGQVVRDYLHVRDLADLCAAALGADESLTLNVGTGHGQSLLEVVEAIQRVTGRTLRMEFRPARSTDVPVSILDSGLARRRFGWTPRVAFEDGLAETWDWVRTRA